MIEFSLRGIQVFVVVKVEDDFMAFFLEVTYPRLGSMMNCLFGSTLADTPNLFHFSSRVQYCCM